MKNYRHTVDGIERWYEDGKLHRLNGPAVIGPDGREIWYKDGLPHRQSGPAFIDSDGRQEWWIDGVRITRTHLKKLNLQGYPKKGFTDEQVALLRIMR